MVPAHAGNLTGRDFRRSNILTPFFNEALCLFGQLIAVMRDRQSNFTL